MITIMIRITHYNKKKLIFDLPHITDDSTIAQATIALLNY